MCFYEQNHQTLANVFRSKSNQARCVKTSSVQILGEKNSRRIEYKIHNPEKYSHHSDLSRGWLYGLMQSGGSNGQEPISNISTNGLLTCPDKIDSHKDDMFNRHSQLICVGGAECLIAFVGRGENDIKIDADIYQLILI